MNDIREDTPSPFGRGQGEGLRICETCDPHPPRFYLGFALSGSRFAASSPKGRGRGLQNPIFHCEDGERPNKT
jgi:hypothetical protein